MKKYKVIWFDDEHETFEYRKNDARKKSILLFGYDNADTGISELKLNIELYDAVIVDGKFYNNSNQTGDTVDDTALLKVARFLDKIESRKKIPWFILSGQSSFIDEINSIAYEYKANKVYNKKIDKDYEQLWSDVKNEADNQIDTQIRHNHPDVFSIFSAHYLSSEVELQVLELIKAKLPTNRVEIKAMLSNVRSIHESCFLKLEEINVLPNAHAKFNDIIKHLSGNKSSASNYKSTTEVYQNDAIENLHKWIYFTCGKYIHNLKDEDYNDYQISNYAIESLRTGLLELLLWFKKTYEENK